MTTFHVHRTIVRNQYGTLEADSHQQAADMLRANMWDDCVQPSYGRKSRETITYKVNGVPLRDRRTNAAEERLYDWLDSGEDEWP